MILCDKTKRVNKVNLCSMDQQKIQVKKITKISKIHLNWTNISSIYGAHMNVDKFIQCR